jgi:hypothetical protein
MRAISTDIKAIVGKLGPVVARALEGAIRRAMGAENPEVTSDHLLRALLDLPDCDLCVSMTDAHVERTDVAARLDWHLARLKGGHKGKPVLAPALLLLLEDAGKLTSDRVRSGHVTAALLADPALSAADAGKVLAALPRLPLHLLSSRFEDRGELGRAPAAAEPAPAAAKSAAPAPAAAPVAAPAAAPVAAPAVKVVAPASAQVAAKAVAASPAPAVQVAAPANAAALRARFADRLASTDAGGLTLSARVGERQTTLRLEWDTDARVIVLRIALPADPPGDAVSAAVALSTLNNALPQGAFVLDEGRLAFRSHVFLDAEGNAPLEVVAFAVRVCEQAAEALG